MPPPLRVTELTPGGRGAIATLLVEGPGAMQAVAALLHTRRGQPAPCLPGEGLALHYIGNPPGEEVIVRARGAESVEIHCHGGLMAAATIQRQLVARGCQAAAWRDWLRGGSLDPPAAAAQVALADARTERTAGILLDQYHGALRRDFDAIEAAIARHDTAAATERIHTLLARADLGMHLVAPWRVVLAGRPNVGKSSLINALAGYARVIVHPAPGTTRDAVAVHTAFGGWPVELSDTAGLRSDLGHDAVEQAGIELAREKLAAADLAVLVFDRSGPWTDAEQALAAAWPDAMVVHNKCDLPRHGQPRPSGLEVSALKGEGVESLAAAIAARLVPEAPPAGTAVPFTAEQVARLKDWGLAE